MGYREVMGIPVRTFWFLNNTINRVRADEDLRHLTVVNSAQSGEGAKDTRERLIIEMGQVIERTAAEDELDRTGLHSLAVLQKAG